MRKLSFLVVTLLLCVSCTSTIPPSQENNVPETQEQRCKRALPSNFQDTPTHWEDFKEGEERSYNMSANWQMYFKLVNKQTIQYYIDQKNGKRTEDHIEQNFDEGRIYKFSIVLVDKTGKAVVDRGPILVFRCGSVFFIDDSRKEADHLPPPSSPPPPSILPGFQRS